MKYVVKIDDLYFEGNYNGKLMANSDIKQAQKFDLYDAKRMRGLLIVNGNDNVKIEEYEKI